MQWFKFIIPALLTIASSSIEAKIETKESLHGVPPDILSHIDLSIDPCKDFYKFSCGGWIKSNELKPSQATMQLSFDTVRENNMEMIVSIANEDNGSLGRFWKSCMNIDKTKASNNKRLHEDLKRIKDAKNKADLMKLVGEFSRTGTNAFIKFSIHHGLRISAADLTLPNSDLYRHEHIQSIVKEYEVYINDLMKLSGFSVPKTQRRLSIFDSFFDFIKAKLQAIKERVVNFFRNKLQRKSKSEDKASEDEKKTDDVPSDQGVSKKVVKKDYSLSGPASIVLDIEEQLASIKPQHSDPFVGHLLKHATTKFPLSIGRVVKGGLNKDSGLIDVRINYFQMLEEFLNNHVTLHDLKVYLAFTMIHSRVKWLDNDFLQVWFKFFGKKLNGLNQMPDRSSFCAESLMEYVPDLIGKHFYEKAFDTARHNDALKMLELIKDAMASHIAGIDWMSAISKKQANLKLGNLLTLVGKPRFTRSYPNDLFFDIYPENIYHILTHLNDYRKNMHWEVPASSHHWYYKEGENKLVLPAGVLQPPIYNGPNAPPARNFGAIGSIMGHGLILGFDEVGSQFDGAGMFDRWWDAETERDFNKAAVCMKNQYSAFAVTGERGVIGTVNGEVTLRNNMADNGGVALAWDAYRKYLGTMPPKTNHIASDVGDKLFFLAYGQTFCTKSRDEFLMQQMQHHTPNEWRVNGVVMNNEDFARAFSCNVDPDPLRPRQQKCNIW